MSQEILKEIREEIQALTLLARQTGTPSHVLLEMQRDIREMKQTLVEVVKQATKTNGRVTALELLNVKKDAYISGVKFGGKAVWGGIILFITGLGISFWDIVKLKLGLK